MIDDPSPRVLELRKRILERMTEEEREEFVKRLAGRAEPSHNSERPFITRVREFFLVLWAIAFFVVLFVGAGFIISGWIH